METVLSVSKWISLYKLIPKTGHCLCCLRQHKSGENLGEKKKDDDTSLEKKLWL